jgi:PAS domain S-box-containing protein
MKKNNSNKENGASSIVEHLRFIDVIEMLSDGVIIINNEGEIIYANPRAESIFGYENGQMIGKSHDILVPKQSREKHKNFCKQYFLEPTVIQMGGIHKDMTGLRKNGGEFYIDAGISLIKAKEELFALIIIRDITKQKHTQAALKNSKDYLEKLNDAIQDGVFTVKLPERRIEYVNKSVEKIFGYSRNGLIGQPTEIIYPNKKEYEIFGKKLRNVIETGEKILQTEQLYKRKNGQIFPGEITVTFTSEEDGLRAIGVVKDITERKHAEEALEAKKQELVLQNKMTSDFLNILEITSTSLNFHEALIKILPFISSFLMASSHCVTYHLDERKEILQPCHQWKLSPEELAYFMSSSVALSQHKEIASNQKIIFEKYPDGIFSSLPDSVKRLFENIGTKSLLMIPITYEGEIRFLLITTYTRHKFFNNRDKELASKLQKHLEFSFISHIHSLNLLYKTMDLTQQLEMSEAVSSIDRSILSSTTEEETIYGNIKLFGKVMPSEITEILKFDAEKNYFKLIASYENEQIHINIDKMLRPEDIKSFISIKFGMPAYYPDLSREKIVELYEKSFLERGFKSMLVIPLLSKGELIGLISIGNSKAAAYSPDHLSVAQRLGNQIAVALSNTNLIKQLQELLVGTIKSLTTAMDAKSKWTRGHSERVSKASLKIGKALGMSDSRLYDLKLAALFHDIGKIGTYDIILDKPQKLTDDERFLIKKHPVKTFEILSPIPKLKDVAKYALHHHERWDGKGYPDGLAGEETPYISRIITLADAHDAMTSDRPYRKGLTTEEAISEIENLSGKQFDPEIAEVFIELLKKERATKKKKAA